MTGFANFGEEEFLNDDLATNPDGADIVIRAM